jgi:PIN domain nuclease of toxin-antitoxin system
VILLDTCALLWLDSDRAVFPAATLAVLDRHADALAVSAVSFMEVGINAQKGRLDLPSPLDEWTERVCARYSLRVHSITREIAVRAVALPPVHRDPFDRLIIATAELHHMRVVTADDVLRKYLTIKVIW